MVGDNSWICHSNGTHLGGRTDSLLGDGITDGLRDNCYLRWKKRGSRQAYWEAEFDTKILGVNKKKGEKERRLRILLSSRVLVLFGH